LPEPGCRDLVDEVDEVDEVGEPALLGARLGLLRLERVGKVGAQLVDIFLGSASYVGDVLGVRARLSG